MNWRYTVLLLAVLTSLLRAEVSLVATGSVWKYRADNADLGTAWRSNFFDDAAWFSGSAQFGWGEGDERTALFSGPSTEESPLTSYFRKTFSVTNSISTLTLRLLCDDGAIVYLNGQEVLRHNLPDGPVDALTVAGENLEEDENRYVQYGAFPNVLRQGQNTIAVEVHQSSDGRHDASFDFALIGNIPQARPLVTILTPEHGATLPSNLVRLTANATDADGHVAEVRYFLDGIYIGSGHLPLFEFLHVTGPGVHAVRVVAYDDYGYFTETAARYFQVGSAQPVFLLRGPYLQVATSTGVTVRWRTGMPTNSVVRHGLSQGNLNSTAVDATRTSEHEIRLEGLQPDTTYFYEIAASGQVLANGPSCRFRTAPTNARPFNVWVIGDAGTANGHQESVRDSYLDALGPGNTDVWLMLGDNAYEEGTDDQYQTAVFEMYADILAGVPLWPTLGNHDAARPDAGGGLPYFDIFTLPTQGEAGGLPSGTEKYYSFDHANAHFICLDSQTSDRGTNGPMLAWLREDLLATDKDWIIAYWHHPPYTFGTHNSDGELNLIQMRENILPALEAYGVDLVLCGHSHVYERSFLLNGHYGYSGTLAPGMVLDASLGHEDVAPYRKPAGGLGADLGTVYAVCGCSGEGGEFGVFARHPAMALNLSGFGSMIINIDGLKLTSRFLRPNGEIADSFTLDKSQPATVRPSLEIARTVGGALLSWPTSHPAYALETTEWIAASGVWQTATNSVTKSGRRNVVNLGVATTNRFFRLRAEP